MNAIPCLPTLAFVRCGKPPEYGLVCAAVPQTLGACAFDNMGPIICKISRRGCEPGTTFRGDLFSTSETATNSSDQQKSAKLEIVVHDGARKLDKLCLREEC